MMTLIRHTQVMRIIFRRYTNKYMSRRPFFGKSLDDISEMFLKDGIKIQTIEHNKKLTVTIELDGNTTTING